MRLLEDYDVTRAHMAAPYVLAEWEKRGARYWRGAFLNPFVGAIIPLLGCLAFGWPSGLVLLALTVDVAMLWICDIAKMMLAPSCVEEERAHHDEAGDVLAVIHALNSRDVIRDLPLARYRLTCRAAVLHGYERSTVADRTSSCLFSCSSDWPLAVIFPYAVPLAAGGACCASASRAADLACAPSGRRRPELRQAGIQTWHRSRGFTQPPVVRRREYDASAVDPSAFALIISFGLHLAVAGVATLQDFAIAAPAHGTARVRRARSERLRERVRQING